MVPGTTWGHSLLSQTISAWCLTCPFQLLLLSFTFVSDVLSLISTWSLLLTASVLLSVKMYRSAIARIPRKYPPKFFPTPMGEVIAILFLHINVVVVYCFGMSISIPVHNITVYFLVNNFLCHWLFLKEFILIIFQRISTVLRAVYTHPSRKQKEIPESPMNKKH